MKNPQNLPAVRENVKKCQKESNPAGCELLSNFISLTDWKQHNLDKELSHNYLDYVSRIKKIR